MEGAPFIVYNLGVGLLTGLGVVYFLALERTEVGFRRSLFVTTAGLVLFLVGGPVAEVLAPRFVHWVHGTAAVLVVVGLYDPLERDLRREVWSELLLDEPARIRQPPEWMLPIDDAILQLFHTSELVLTPSIVAYNIEYSREEVNRRLAELEERGYVERVERGKYRVTALGRQYIESPVSYGLTGRLRSLWRPRT
ncbi:ArsR family transcriptional regulator [Natronomonas salina]|uniref:ArsR family transcriptional regulator n=1 Tax=Natronomonas salina TaxID=1710540 RepID=UPI0015B42D3E|nr:ArsR family transcriptional regulator [Natronomonas salina]QLD89451.1 ArsR family transcriptional regulator [Natronomonas salina]